MRELDLNALLGETNPFASFHDAVIHTIHLDYQARIAQMECTLYIGDPDAKYSAEREVTADGVLSFSGLLYCVIEPPTDNGVYQEGGLDISSNGNAATTQFKSPWPALPQLTEPNAFVHWFFVTSWNAFVFIAATEARFVWKL